MNLRAVLYTRVSSDQQVSNTSLDEQERIGMEYCNANDYTLLKVFREEGESAKYIDRTELTKALAFCEDRSNKVDLFLVYKMDRFSRSLENHLQIRKLLKMYGVRLVSMTENFEDTPSGLLMENIMASFAQFDNEVKRERVVGGMIAKLKQGIWVWGCPPGYARENKLLTRDLLRWDVINDAWNWYASGKYSQSEIITFLDDQSFKTSRGSKPHISMVSKMFHNPLYMGKIVAKNFDVEVDGIHEPMVTKAMWYEVQDRLNGIENRVVVGGNPSFVLNRTLMCGGCGRSLSGAFSRGKLGGRYGYYSCTSNTCINKERLPQKYAEDMYLDLLSGLRVGKEIADEVKSKVVKRIEVMGKEELQKRIAIKTQITEHLKEIDRIGDKLDIGFYSKEEAIKRKKEIESKIDRLEILQEKAAVQHYNIESILDYSFKILEHLPEAWRSLDTKDKIGLNRFVFPEGIKIVKKQTSNPRINPLFEAIDNVHTSSLSFGDPNASVLEPFFNLFKLVKSFNLSFNLT